MFFSLHACFWVDYNNIAPDAPHTHEKSELVQSFFLVQGMTDAANQNSVCADIFFLTKSTSFTKASAVFFQFSETDL